jgi:hypothetical protein
MLDASLRDATTRRKRQANAPSCLAAAEGYNRGMRGVIGLLLLGALAACHPSTVQDYADTVAGLPPEVRLAWHLEVVGDVARWRECTAPDACGQLERSRPADEVLRVERAGHVLVDGQEVDVLRLSLAARRSCDYAGCSDMPQR